MRELEYGIPPSIEKVNDTYKELIKSTEVGLGDFSVRLESVVNRATGLYTGLGKSFSDVAYESYEAQTKQFKDQSKIIDRVKSKEFAMVKKTNRFGIKYSTNQLKSNKNLEMTSKKMGHLFTIPNNKITKMLGVADKKVGGMKGKYLKVSKSRALKVGGLKGRKKKPLKDSEVAQISLWNQFRDERIQRRRERVESLKSIFKMDKKSKEERAARINTLDKMKSWVHAPIVKVKQAILENGSVMEAAGDLAEGLLFKVANAVTRIVKFIAKMALYGIIVMGVLFGLYTLFKQSGVKEKLEEIWANTMAFFNYYVVPWLEIAGAGISKIIEGFQDGEFFKVIEGVLQIIGGLVMASLAIASTIIKLGLDLLWEGVKGFGAWIKANWKDSKSKVLSVLGYIAAGILFLVAFFSGLWVIALAGVILTAISYLIEKFTPFADGGTTTSGLSLVGEKGPELVKLPVGSKVHSNANSQKMLSAGGSNTTNITVQVQGRIGASDAEVRDMADKVAREVNLRMNRTGAAVTNFG